MVGDLIPYDELTGDSFQYRYWVALGEVSNREFNNSGGITSATIDYGPVGGLVFCGLLGALFGAGYVAFRQARRWGLLFYPVFVMGMLEMSRVFYLGAGRCVPGLVGLVYVAIRLRKARLQDEHWGYGPRPMSPLIGELADESVVAASTIREPVSR